MSIFRKWILVAACVPAICSCGCQWRGRRAVYEGWLDWRAVCEPRIFLERKVASRAGVPIYAPPRHYQIVEWGERPFVDPRYIRPRTPPPNAAIEPASPAEPLPPPDSQAPLDEEAVPEPRDALPSPAPSLPEFPAAPQSRQPPPAANDSEELPTLDEEASVEGPVALEEDVGEPEGDLDEMDGPEFAGDEAAETANEEDAPEESPPRRTFWNRLTSGLRDDNDEE